MKIIIEGCNDLGILSIEQLSQFIPVGLNGKPLNYGQGEGQMEIEGTVWGIYCNKNTYLLQFEEGSLDWLTMQKLVVAILENISEKFGREIKYRVEGCLD